MTISPVLFPAITVTVVRDRKIQTVLRTNQIEEFVTMPSWKKISYIIIDLRLNLAYFRDPDKMAHSLSTSQKTFFGRGRGR